MISENIPAQFSQTPFWISVVSDHKISVKSEISEENPGDDLSWNDFKLQQMFVIHLQCVHGLPISSSKSYISILGISTHIITNCPVAQSKIQVYKRAANFTSHSLTCVCYIRAIYNNRSLLQISIIFLSLSLSALKSCTNKSQSLISSTTAVIFGPLTIETAFTTYQTNTCADIIRIIIHNVNIRRLLDSSTEI